ncbi:MAG: DUF3179 domain-containing protein [Pseudomonadota bacterium]
MTRHALFGALLAAAIAGPALAFAQAAPESWLREWPRTDFSNSLVAFEEIFSGGPPKDGIPSIDAPRFDPVAEGRARHADREPVMSVEIDGDARAYPLSILVWHEIVNDTVGGVPVAVTFCPLCNSGVVFSREVDGVETTFGTTGKLRRSDLVMYDRATESWWQQFEGRAILGARAGTELERLPHRLENVADFAERRPGGRILRPPEPATRPYGRNPYAGYDQSARPMLYRGAYDGPGRPLMRVVAVKGRDEAWSLPLLRERGVIRDGDLEIAWRPGQASALDAGRIAEGRDVGSVTVRRRGADGVWRDAVHDIPFAFAFRAFRPDAPIRHLD